ncbi:response regulator transcription factor [[Flexibacter] sp. ATCC 35208]|uniref:response regulator transcription factor n=1 Tax=[Flexibacter] sp. ATCC 35208 TaxID=1936242 RepID=UPI0009D05FA6|nr:response regulator transcription factor [[Flexibacter] sp. ATCC 35208]OMP77550.1 DNA-binding response regulator [[Flexibacter] sp. ATCC 35208]
MKKIAIVDDQVMIRKALSVLINMFPGYEVMLDAADGKDLQRQLQEEHLPHIVLLDIVMPNMDGYETAGWLRDNYPDIKVLALSTMDADTAIIKMIKHGAKGYVLKDADPAELKLAFDEVIRQGYFYNELITRKVMNSIHALADDKSDLKAFAKLTDRELQFLRLACSEKTYQQIAAEMFVSERTVDGYREALCKKLNLNTRVGLVMFAIRNNIVQL